MNKKCLFLYLLICLLVVGCATMASSKNLPEPDNENQTLVVGSTTYENGLLVYLKKISSGKTYIMQSVDGFFYSVQIPPGSYNLSKISERRNNLYTFSNIYRI